MTYQQQQDAIEDANHRNDPRVACRNRNGLDVDDKRMVAVLTIEDDEGDEYYVEVPFQWEVCYVCDGKGEHVDPNIDSNGLTRADFDDDPDFEQSYFSGAYDVQCECCHGRRVMASLVEDPEKLTEKQKAAIQYQHDMAQCGADYAAECEAERRAGC